MKIWRIKKVKYQDYDPTYHLGWEPFGVTVDENIERNSGTGAVPEVNIWLKAWETI